MFEINNYIEKIKNNKKNKIHENYQYIHIETFKNKNTYNLYIKELLDNFDFEIINKIKNRIDYENEYIEIRLIYKDEICIKSYIYIYNTLLN